MKKQVHMIFLIVLILSLFSLSVLAKSGRITLLAVSELEDGTYQGSTADLYLEIKPGTGRVFIDTFPITKLDTQMTTRFAKETACKFLDEDCSEYDFFYTINAHSSIIAGPSAGAATTILTISLLKDIPLDKDTAITGTINSGYLIGTVGGLKEKIIAAKKDGAKKVLIPIAGEYTENNISENFSQLGDKLNISVIEISDLNEAMLEFTGESFGRNFSNFSISDEYKKVMKDLAISLCNRTVNLERAINRSVFNASELERFENITNSSFIEFENERYYSSASMCFGVNVNYLEKYLLQSQMSILDYKLSVIKTKNEAESLLDEITSNNITTITDLEASIIVRERLTDVIYYADLTEKANTTKEKARLLAYSLERLNSAYLWKNFFGISGDNITLDKDSLKSSCQMKISEAEERYQYASLYFPSMLVEIKAEINHALDYFNREEYVFCLFKATQAKARSNVIISSISVDTRKVDILLDQKLGAARRAIAEESQKGIFPVLGYSYYEYASTLREEDPYSALIYAEYALELSNLDIYFKAKSNKTESSDKSLMIFDWKSSIIFVFGILVGISAAVLANAGSRKKSLKRKSSFKKKKRA